MTSPFFFLFQKSICKEPEESKVGLISINLIIFIYIYIYGGVTYIFGGVSCTCGPSALFYS